MREPLSLLEYLKKIISLRGGRYSARDIEDAYKAGLMRGKWLERIKQKASKDETST